MGLGNGNPNSGNKGSNWRYEYNVLTALQCIVENTTAGGDACCPATNALLTEIAANTANIEVSIGAGDVTVELTGVESRLDTVIANQTNGTQVVTLPSGTQSVNSSLVTTSGSTSAGSTSTGFATSFDFVGTINGVTRIASEFYGFESAPGKTLAAIPYTVTAGSIVIDTIV